MSRKKVKSAGKIPQDFTAGIKVFLQRSIANFQAKILDKVIIVTADGKFVLKTDKITAA